MSADTWLERWLPEIGPPSAQRPVLDLGCGAGEDAAYLARRGYRVIAADLDTRQLDRCARNVNRASLLRLDLRAPLPFAGESFPVILAGLCLHYFPWRDTSRIVQEVRRCLAGDGLLLCRLNSTRDVHFGASGYPPIDPSGEDGYYQVGDRRKRFFAERDVRRLFADGWTVESLQERTSLRYERPKAVWEAALRKKGIP